MKPKTWINLIVVSALLVASFGLMPATQPAAQAAAIVRVKPGGSTAPGCGDSWANACDLQTALTAASAGDELWAAAGTYKPGTNREDTFQLVSGVALYGGFAGTETSREQRDWDANLTVLSGDIGVEADSSDNSYHVVTGSGVDGTAILDGFTVAGGNADGDYYPAFNGGGMVIDAGSPSLANVTFSGNRAGNGGGMANWDSGPTLTHVAFIGNRAEGWGGGMNNREWSAPNLTNVIFIGNSAGGGGGMSNGWGSYGGSYPKLTNVTFSGNQAGGYQGGGMLNEASSPSIVNSIFWGNTAESDAQIANLTYYTGYGTVVESRPSIQYSNVQGGCTTISGNNCSGGGNIDADPLFVRNPDPGADGTWGTEDDDYGDLRLQNGSPATDAADNTATGLVGITTDLDGNPRFYDVPEMPDTGVGPPPVVDMGAYEKQANHAPVAEDNSYSTNEDVPLHVGAPGILANDSDPNSDPLTAVLESGPSSGALNLYPDGSFDYLPETDYHGVVTFTYQAKDGLMVSNTATVTITVSSVNDAPIAVNDTYTTTKNASLTINAPGVLENDSDPDGDPLSAVLESGPSSGSLDFYPDGSFDYLPEKDYHGVVTFTYHATDNLMVSNTATVTIKVNGAPIAVNDIFITTKNVSLTISTPGVLENDSDPDGDPLSAVLESGPSSGFLTLNQDGSFTYLPEVGYTGVVTFTYRATDSLLDSNTATVTITVIKVGSEVYLPMIIR